MGQIKVHRDLAKQAVVNYGSFTVLEENHNKTVALSMEIFETLDDIKCFLYENPVNSGEALLSHVNVAMISIDLVELAKVRKAAYTDEDTTVWELTLYQYCSSLLGDVRLVVIEARKCLRN